MNSKSLRDYCLNDNTEESTHKSLNNHLGKENSILKVFFKNDLVVEWLKNDDIRNETYEFIRNNDSSVDIEKIDNYWKNKNDEAKRKTDTRDLKEIIKIKGKEYGFSKYLVTNSWYDEFIKDEGYKKESFWESAESNKYRKEFLKNKNINSYKDLYNDNEKEFLGLQQPIVNISFYEAKAFCAWLTEKSKLDDEKENYIFDLPSNEEFEYVATKGIKQKYPWGKDWNNKKCNNSNTNIDSTSVVGLFSPDGDSPFGICDMSGNVWKWTSSDSKKYKRAKILKGGSWLNSDGDSFMASYEGSYDSDDLDSYLGFFLTRTK